MARPKAFDEEQALDAAIAIFREHGFDGTSADMLVQALGIGRQSLYDTFGDKWRLYLAAVRRYSATETQAHIGALRSGTRAIDGIAAMVERVVADAGNACLGVGSVCEFGRSEADLVEVHAAAGRAIHNAIVKRVRGAQSEGDVDAGLDPRQIAQFLVASFAGIRVAARGGADAKELRALGRFALRALR